MLTNFPSHVRRGFWQFLRGLLLSIPIHYVLPASKFATNIVPFDKKAGPNSLQGMDQVSSPLV